MKKILALALFTALLLTSSALAAPQEIDIDAMSREELYGLIDQARTALLKFDAYASGDYVLLDDAGVKITFTGIDLNATGQYVYANVIVENNTSDEISITPEDVCLNGWATGGSGIRAIPAGKMAMGKFDIQVKIPNGISDISAIEDIELSVCAYKQSYSEQVSRSDIIRISFK